MGSAVAARPSQPTGAAAYGWKYGAALAHDPRGRTGGTHEQAGGGRQDRNAIRWAIMVWSAKGPPRGE
ncbi:hypothetical protein Acsp01_83410 [Actinoplanes sp. NBRC 101535]|nr:hypothetical protein Acsp01_83410 [Actinoplanes sp. NBRC 101535]